MLARDAHVQIPSQLDLEQGFEPGAPTFTAVITRLWVLTQLTFSHNWDPKSALQLDLTHVYDCRVLLIWLIMQKINSGQMRY